MEPAGSAGGWRFQHLCFQGMSKQNERNKDGLLHGLIRRTLGLSGGLSGRWGHTRWETRWENAISAAKSCSQLIAWDIVQRVMTDEWYELYDVDCHNEVVTKTATDARCHQLSVLRVRRSTCGSRAFSVTGPTVLNLLPDHLQNPAAESSCWLRKI